MEKEKIKIPNGPMSINSEVMHGNFNINGHHYRVEYKWADYWEHEIGKPEKHRYCQEESGILEET